MLPKPEHSPLKLPRDYLALALDKLGLRGNLGYIVVIIVCGCGIVAATGLHGGVEPQTALYWLCYEYSVGMLFVLWQVNRRVWRMESRLQRRFPTPLLKPMLYLTALVLITAPLAIMLCLGWFWLAEWQVRWDIIQSMVLWNALVISVLTFLYETTVLSREREANIMQMEKFHRASIQAELEALKLQLDPHFLFNSLNTLSHLIESDTASAQVFNDNLAEVYRYMITHRNKALVRLSEELSLLESYYTLLRLRFRGGVELRIESCINADEYVIAPLALQLLLENAVKHNELSEERPLTVEVRIDTDAVTMSNPRRPKRVMRHKADSGSGLRNLDERVKLTMRQRIAIVESEKQFFVRIPLERL
jgi:sensor histidine kinase YesM